MHFVARKSVVVYPLRCKFSDQSWQPMYIAGYMLHVSACILNYFNQRTPFIAIGRC